MLYGVESMPRSTEGVGASLIVYVLRYIHHGNQDYLVKWSGTVVKRLKVAIMKKALTLFSLASHLL